MVSCALLSILLFSAPHSLAAVESTTYIVGGDDAERDYPWMVAIYYGSANAGYGFICGGVLVSSNWIATAGHCVYDDDDSEGNATAYAAANFKVVIGESTHYSEITAATAAGVDVYGINNVIINSDYDDSTVDYDIALLEIDSAYYQPGPAIATADRFATIAENDLLKVVGYGYTSGEQTDADIPTSLQEAEIPFVSTSHCYWNDYDMVTDNMFCAGYDSTEFNVDSCSGDSGGPVFTTLDGELTLVGLVSWGTTACASYPGVYTNVSNLRDWVLENIDGMQVVEEGVGRYNSDSETFSDGLISVYHYGSNDDIDSTITISSLAFSDSDYASTLSVNDGCSDSYLEQISDDVNDCAIDFSLYNVVPDDDQEFTATLAITPGALTSSQSYDLRFVVDLTSDEQLTSSYDGSDSDDDSSGGSLGLTGLLLLLLLGWWRYRATLTLAS